MPHPYKVIHVGTGGFGRRWCEHFLPPNIKEGLIDVVAAVDIDAKALANARQFLGLRNDQCYTDLEDAFDANRADICTVVVPPEFHEQVVRTALKYDAHILSEKPIADTLDASIRIADMVRSARKKMGVTMSHRFDQDKTTLRKELRCGQYGKLDYLVCRFTYDGRAFGSCGVNRHEMADPLLIQGSVHHLDILADLADSKCDTIYAQTWNPPWGEFAGDSQALITIHFENNTRAIYEGAWCNAVGLNGWGDEYIRAECEQATLILNRRRLLRFDHDPKKDKDNRRAPDGKHITLLEQPKWRNTWLIEKFVQWLDGGQPMETNVEDNLQSVAMVFGAIASSRSGQPVKVQQLLEKTRQQVQRK